MSGKAQRHNAVAPQLTGLWVPLTAAEDVISGVSQHGLTSVMSLNSAATQQLARQTCVGHPEPWDEYNTRFLHDYLSGMFLKALQQRFVFSFHGRVFAKPQMTAINVDARGPDGRSPIAQAVPFANVSFASRSGANVVEVATELGTVTITSRSKALLFATGLLGAQGEPLYCLATPHGKTSGLSAGRGVSKQAWQLNWVLNADELASKLSPALNNGRTHERSNVKHRLEPLPLQWQPPSANFLREAPGSLLAMDPRKPVEYNIDLEDRANVDALPSVFRQLGALKLQAVVQKVVESSLTALRYNYRDAMCAFDPQLGYHLCFPVVLTPACCSELGLPSQTVASTICAAAAVPSTSYEHHSRPVSPSSSAAAPDSHGTLSVVALRPLAAAAVSTRLLSRSGGVWATSSQPQANPGYTGYAQRSATVMLASDPIAGSAVASLVSPATAPAHPTLPASRGTSDTGSTMASTREHSYGSAAASAPSREAVAAAAASLSRSLSSAAASTRSDSAARSAPQPGSSQPRSPPSNASASASSAGVAVRADGVGTRCRQGSAFLPPAEHDFTGYFDEAPAPSSASKHTGGLLAMQKSTPILPSERASDMHAAPWRRQGGGRVPPPAPPMGPRGDAAPDVGEKQIRRQSSSSSATTAPQPPSHLTPAQHRQDSTATQLSRGSVQSQSWRDAPVRDVGASAPAAKWGRPAAESTKLKQTPLMQQASLPVPKRPSNSSIDWVPRRHSAVSPGAAPPHTPLEGVPEGLLKGGPDLPDWAQAHSDAAQLGGGIAQSTGDDDEPGGMPLAAAGGGVGGHRRASQASEATSMHDYESDEHVDDYPSEIPPPKPRPGAELGLGATLFAQTSVKANSNPTNSAASRRDSLLSAGNTNSRRGSAASVASVLKSSSRRGSTDPLSLLSKQSRQGSVALD